MNTRNLAIIAALAIASDIAVSGSAQASTMKADREMTKLAAMLFRDVDAAQSALSSGNTTNAGSDINDALTAHKDMAEMARTYGTSMVVPLYGELDDQASLAHTLRNRSGSSPLDVRGNTISATYVAIDLDKAKKRLDRAQTALGAKQIPQAKRDLAAIGSDLIVATVATDDPLLTAREDLALADRAAMANRPAVARADLQQAANALKRYNGTAHASDAKRVASEMNSSGSQTASPQSVSAKIAFWWSSVTSWFSAHT